MPSESNVELAVSRTLRDNLGKLQRTADELHQAIADLVAACASNRPTNSLPAMLRAQTAAASLAAALDVLARFVTASLQAARPAAETQVDARPPVIVQAPEPAAMPTMPPPSIPTPMSAASQRAASEGDPAANMIAEGAPIAPPEAVGVAEPAGDPAPIAAEEAAELEQVVEEQIATFDVRSLPQEEQELHRRANRVAKVSMQDIKMLRPEQVRLGREHKDLCIRLHDDIEKARKEYDRRFRSIMGHPVDYFYHWMVEILAGGDPEALGEYPYPSPVLRR